MKILLLSSSYNSLTQKAHVELQSLGHKVSVELAINQDVMFDAVTLFEPDLILCPMLTHIIPKQLWQKTPCIIIHPGVKGDRGAASLDWAIMNEEKVWGVTAVQAADEVDSGPIWASCHFKMRNGSKSSIYRDELSDAALQVIRTAVSRFENGHYIAEPLDYSREDVTGRYRAFIKQEQRAIDWQTDSVATILKKIRSADSSPGLVDTINGEEFYVYGAHREGSLIGPPGQLIAQRHGAICRAATDGAVWITHLKRKNDPHKTAFKLPATQVLGLRQSDLPYAPIDNLHTDTADTFKEIWYRQQNEVAYLYFEFYNGAMSTEQCTRLTQAYQEAASRSDVKVVVLMGGRDFWSNGIHLNLIEAANNPADESWANINAMNDLVHAIMTTKDKLVISAMHGNAGAGGVMMALAADKILARHNVVLNPHYKGMGGLYGSEYWTYLLPKRVGAELARVLTDSCLPISAEQAKNLQLIDDVVYQDPGFPSTFHEQISRLAESLASHPEYEIMLAKKATRLDTDQQQKPFSAYRKEELAHMRENFYGTDDRYHQARHQFVCKQKLTATPAHLATHRQSPPDAS